jgi:Leucine Rich Repeat (LRR) protein
MSISELNKNVWGHVALFLEEVHPFAQASRVCHKIVKESFYPAFFNAYLKKEEIKFFADNLGESLSDSEKARIVYLRIVGEMRARGGGEEVLEKFHKPRSLHPDKLALLALLIIENRDNNLNDAFKKITKGLPAATTFLAGLQANAHRADAIRDWMSKNPQELCNVTKFVWEYDGVIGFPLTAIPKEISSFVALKELFLRDHNVVSIPSALFQLKRLERLVVWDCKLRSVPSQIGEVVSLQGLILRDNLLTAIPKELGKLSNLKILNIARNKLAEIPREIGMLSNLSTLHVGDNQLTTLPIELNHLDHLTMLILERNPLKAVPRALKESDIHAIRDNPEIKGAAAIEPTLCEQICEMLWGAWTWFVDGVKAFYDWLCS